MGASKCSPSSKYQFNRKYVACAYCLCIGSDLFVNNLPNGVVVFRSAVKAKNEFGKIHR
jgi:hypothetical protein